MTDKPQQKGPLAESAEVCCPQRRAHSGPESNQLAGSRNPETKQEARRAFTSELGPINEANHPAGLPAPAGLPQPIVALFDYPADDDPDWDELTARVSELAPADRETVLEMTERVLGRMGL